MKIILTLLMAFIAFPAIAAEDTTNKLRIVESKYICMVNDSVFNKEQISVPVGDKTYYGCCSMCEERLKTDEAIRTAIDPVSGNSVDKAEAVIAVDAKDNVYYFESEKTMKNYAFNSTQEEAVKKMPMDHSKHEGMNHSGHDMAGDSKVVMGKGIIHSVSKMNKKVNLTHEPIPALGWPAMTMDLDVSDDVDLKSIAPDQEVMFHMVLGEDKVYRITEFMKPDAKMDHGDMKHDNSDGHHGDKSHH
jgi:Cu/Ag efflux protein CusF